MEMNEEKLMQLASMLHVEKVDQLVVGNGYQTNNYFGEAKKEGGDDDAVTQSVKIFETKRKARKDVKYADLRRYHIKVGAVPETMSLTEYGTFIHDHGGPSERTVRDNSENLYYLTDSKAKAREAKYDPLLDEWFKGLF